MVRIGKIVPEERRVRFGQSFSGVHITGFPKGSTFPILTHDLMIDYFSCQSTLIIPAQHVAEGI